MMRAQIMDKAGGWDNQPAWDAGWKDVQYKSAGEAWNDSVRNPLQYSLNRMAVKYFGRA